uniref:Uncharacterized protein n=1 Tax=Aegilops tauschii subsp. strangulata TaxID=200361 RepID=A0A453SMS5_AEGTS
VCLLRFGLVIIKASASRLLGLLLSVCGSRFDYLKEKLASRFRFEGRFVWDLFLVFSRWAISSFKNNICAISSFKKHMHHTGHRPCHISFGIGVVTSVGTQGGRP